MRIVHAWVPRHRLRRREAFVVNIEEVERLEAELAIMQLVRDSIRDERDQLEAEIAALFSKLDQTQKVNRDLFGTLKVLREDISDTLQYDSRLGWYLQTIDAALALAELKA
jgi:septal ring factor EnvC (AmiA/AmiB activator)